MLKLYGIEAASISSEGERHIEKDKTVLIFPKYINTGIFRKVFNSELYAEKSLKIPYKTRSPVYLFIPPLGVNNVSFTYSLLLASDTLQVHVAV